MKIIKNIGSGAYGKVYEVELNGKRRAAKTGIPRCKEATIDKETEQLNRVKHTNIVAVFGIQVHENASYLIMELMEGGSMKDLLDPKKQFWLTDVMNWLSQVADGLAYLHAMRPKPMMHRDIKPHNILLSGDLKIAKIGDFGLCRDLSSTMSNDKGSAPYMAPEVFDSKKYTEKCDVYSFAITLWEMVARKKPFAEYDSPEMIKMAAHYGIRPSFKGLVCHKKITKLLTVCWDKDPKVRPEMKTVFEELRQTLILYREFEKSTDILLGRIHDEKIEPVEDKVRNFTKDIQRSSISTELTKTVEMVPATSMPLAKSLLKWAGNKPLIGIVDDSKNNGKIPEEKWSSVEAAVAGVSMELLLQHPGTAPSCTSLGWLRDSIKLMLCEDKRSLKLYKNAIAQLGEVYPGAKLRVVDAEDLRLGPEATALLPNEPSDPEAILQMLRKLNPRVSIKNWKVLEREEGPECQMLVKFQLDKDSVKQLNKCEGILNYGLKKVTLTVSRLDTELSELRQDGQEFRYVMFESAKANTYQTKLMSLYRHVYIKYWRRSAQSDDSIDESFVMVNESEVSPLSLPP